MQQKKIISGLDVIKFIMAILIVDIHVKGTLNLPSPILNNIIFPIEGIAVPLFFIISAFLFFKKLRIVDDKNRTLFLFEKRICTLYLFWIIIWSPIILIQKSYHHYSILKAVELFFKDFFFGYVFDASWFLGALIVGVPIIFVLSRILKKEILVLIFPLIIYLYITYQQFLPENWKLIYNWYNDFKNPNLSFPGGLLWISIGYLMSNESLIKWIKNLNNKMTWSISLILFVLSIFIPFMNIFCITSIFISAYTLELPEKPQLYKRLRIYSILFYVIHDCFKKIPKQLFGLENGPILFLITIIFCFLASEIIIRMSSLEGFKWLKYAY